jgi:hypothetical protein
VRRDAVIIERDEGIFAVNSSATYQKIAEVSIKKNQFQPKEINLNRFCINKLSSSANRVSREAIY